MVRLTLHFRIMPWDVERLTARDFHAYCKAVDAIERELAKSRG